MPWLWDLVDIVNSFLFRIRYGSKLYLVENEICMNGYLKSQLAEDYDILPIREVQTNDLVEFFACQPTEAYNASSR